MARMTTLPEPWQRWRHWLPDATAGVVAFVLAVWEVAHDSSGVTGGASAYLVALLLAVSVGLSRRAPGAALAVAWCLGFLHIATGVQPLVTEILLAVVAFGCARWGGTPVVLLSGVSIPPRGAVGGFLVRPPRFFPPPRGAR